MLKICLTPPENVPLATKVLRVNAEVGTEEEEERNRLFDEKLRIAEEDEVKGVFPFS